MEPPLNEGRGWPHSHWTSCAVCRLQVSNLDFKTRAEFERGLRVTTGKRSGGNLLANGAYLIKNYCNTKGTEKYELSSTTLHTKLVLGQGCSSKMHCEYKNLWAKKGLLSSKTEPQDNQPACNLFKELTAWWWMSTWHCSPSSGLTALWWLLRAPIKHCGHQNKVSIGHKCCVGRPGRQAKQNNRHVKTEARLMLLFWASGQ